MYVEIYSGYSSVNFCFQFNQIRDTSNNDSIILKMARNSITTQRLSQAS